MFCRVTNIININGIKKREVSPAIKSNNPTPPECTLRQVKIKETIAIFLSVKTTYVKDISLNAPLAYFKALCDTFNILWIDTTRI